MVSNNKTELVEISRINCGKAAAEPAGVCQRNIPAINKKIIYGLFYAILVFIRAPVLQGEAGIFMVEMSGIFDLRNRNYVMPLESLCPCCIDT